MLFFICKNVYSVSSLFFLDNRQTFFRKLCKLREKILSTKFATNQSFYGTSLKQIFFIFYRKIILWVTCIFYQTRFSTFYIFYLGIQYYHWFFKRKDIEKLHSWRLVESVGRATVGHKQWAEAGKCSKQIFTDNHQFWVYVLYTVGTI